MPRKSKAELMAEQEAERFLLEAENEAAYPARLMRNLENAVQNFNYILTVKDSVFVLHTPNRNDTWPFRYFNYHYDANSQLELESLESSLADQWLNKRNEERREESRQAALAKLSSEERQLLGL